jgi:tetratricopeptide (TPR) repeat protein
MKERTKAIDKQCGITGWMSLMVVLIWLWIPASGLGQERGAVKIEAEPEPTGKTYAVVVGISDYQSPEIADLQYAAADAQAFVDWLLKVYPDEISPGDITLLTDSLATSSRLDASLEWLMDKCKSGDRAYIYFSGHGDAESRTRNRRGFLLCHDSGPNNYAAGAYALTFLQDKIETLTIDSSVKVYVIMDACRAGKLAGNQVGGKQMTAAELAQQYANEIKILSCQPDEVSLEGKQWGGGRGVFSYYLTEGLTGFADNNGDGWISLMELGRYLQDRIAYDVSPIQQTPMVVGKPNEPLATYKIEQLQSLVARKVKGIPAMMPHDMRGIEEEALAQCDSQTRADYSAFKAALRDRRLMGTDTGSAEKLFQKLIGNSILQPLYPGMKRNFAVALQEEVQQAINALLVTDPTEIMRWHHFPERFNQYPAYLTKAMELIGSRSSYYNSLHAKKLYFEAYLERKERLEIQAEGVVRAGIRHAICNKLLKAMSLDSSAAYICHELAALYFLQIPPSTDSLVYWNQQAIERSPTWLLPYLEIAEEYQVTFSNRFDESERWLKRAVEIDSQSYMIKERLSWLYQRKNQLDKTIDLCLQNIRSRPEAYSGYYTLSCTYAFMRDFERMKPYFIKVHELGVRPFHNEPYFLRNRHIGFFIPYLEEGLRDPSLSTMEKASFAALLAICHFTLGEEAAAGPYLERCRQIQPYFWYNMLLKVIEGRIQLARGQLGIADSLFASVSILDPSINMYPPSQAWRAVVAEKSGRLELADSIFRQSLLFWSGSAWDDFPLQEECHYLYGMFLIRRQRFQEAEEMFAKANELAYANGHLAWFGLACLEAARGNKSKAYDHLERSLACGYPLRRDIENEPLLKSLAGKRRLVKLLDKTF